MTDGKAEVDIGLATVIGPVAMTTVTEALVATMTGATVATTIVTEIAMMTATVVVEMISIETEVVMTGIEVR